MDQVKTGKFIYDMRKEQNLTQKQLAEKLEISDRTISKWECGKGMPEVGLMMPLCEALNINVNELLSGERLSDEHYSNKAEENIIELIRENKQSGKKTLRYVLGYIAAILVILGIVIVSLAQVGVKIIYCLDYATALVLFIVVILFLAVSGLFRDFFRAFPLAFKGVADNDNAALDKLKRAYNAVLLAMKTSIYISIFSVLFYSVALLHELSTVELIGSDMAVMVLSLLYGVFFSMVLLPVRARLKVKIDELGNVSDL
ncbi:MAG: helix-turn-helix domain-containing protein [Clostridium sp.]|nr:helix-turn-helix domain-containing protein [Clostridium sp.]MCM1172966.1 helix-turn-helix domain-containing protein [Clostridium sp.]MCM1209182.1 helix-turn-helix domain-containing protein [Ruminococcus sp.]